MEVTSVFDEYASLDAEEKAIKLKKEQLRPVILKSMVEQGQKKVETSLGSFNVSQTKKWTYPERISVLEESVNEQIKELKDQVGSEKAKAESTNEATCEEVPSLRFVSTKL